MNGITTSDLPTNASSSNSVDPRGGGNEMNAMASSTHFQSHLNSTELRSDALVKDYNTIQQKDRGRNLIMQANSVEPAHVQLATMTSSLAHNSSQNFPPDGQKDEFQQQQQRIQFTIGKKRKKTSAGDQASKRQSHSGHYNNVLEASDSSNKNLLVGAKKNSFQDEALMNNLDDEPFTNNSGYQQLNVKEDEKLHREDMSSTSLGSDAANEYVEKSIVNSQYPHVSPDLEAETQRNNNNVDRIQHGNDIDELSENNSIDRGPNNALVEEQNSKNNVTNTSQVQPLHSIPSQPDGWRVKLYRLNADGSWDDCGTGRIVCLISDHVNTIHHSKTSTLTASGENTSENRVSRYDGSLQVDSSGKEGLDGTDTKLQESKEWAHLEDEIYQQLGMPTLCMHAELPANLQHLAGLANAAPKVLLRTRVLLRESYQRQGDNIITWCEPYFLPAQIRDDQMSQTGVSKNAFLHNSAHQQTHQGNEDIACGVDLALSFQDNAGCRDIWNKISKIQHKAFELFEARGGLSITSNNSIGIRELGHQRHDNTVNEGEMSNNTMRKMGDGNGINRGDRSLDSSIRTEHHNTSVDGIQENINNTTHEARPELWDDTSRNGSPSLHGIGLDVDEHDFMEADTAAAVSMAAQVSHYVGHANQGKGQMFHQNDSIEPIHSSVAQLCNPPTLENLEKIADVIAASQPQQRENIARFVSQSECTYLKALLALFPSAEAKNNYHALATLASIIKSIFLFNEPSIIQLVVSDGQIFEDCCCCLEYDPDLKEKANHRWFIRDRLKFRTVLIMEDEELIDSIHRAFRVTYIRDTLLRPTMDESSLSTLGSLLTFAHGDVVKGVMSNPRNSDAPLKDSYLVRILRLLGKEIRAIRDIEWKTMRQKGRPPSTTAKNHTKMMSSTLSSSSGNEQQPSTPWKQHLAPQDETLQSRKLRRRGCLSFLREMFNMVRMSLQQSDKDDFYAVIVLMDVKLGENTKSEQKESKSAESVSSDNDTVNLLSLLGAILSDTNADVSEKGACLDILSAVASHEPSLIRKHCLDEFSKLGASNINIARPEPNEKRQVVFACPPTDLFLSLLCVMSTENDAGIMLQTCEVIRIILDTEMVNDPTQLDLGGVIDNEEDELIGSDNVSFLVGANPSNGHGGGGCEQNSFLQMFYDHYVPWLVAPFQYSILIPKTAIPFSYEEERINENDSLLQFLMRKHQSLKDAKISRTGLLKMVSTSAIRLSFSVELLSFCVRTHCYRMKRYLINSRVLINVMKMLSPRSSVVPSGDRCLKLGALRCLRSIISLKDEFYNRHIVQHSLFTPVFEAFRANPVGDNLVSSSIIEICEFIRTENIKSLIEYIVTKHMQQTTTQQSSSSNDTANFKLPPCLEDLATPYVSTLTLLREKYEENVSELTDGTSERDKGKRVGMSEKAMEDQRKFREADEEESYFFDDVEDCR